MSIVKPVTRLRLLVDGRSVYNRIFSGVFWDAADLMLDDIDRMIGQHLVDAAHAECAGAGSFLLATQVPRSAGLRLRVTFP